MEQHIYALFIALCKVYDNYITPLNTRIKCWKSKSHTNNCYRRYYFVLGMTIIQFDGSVRIITYHIPIELWDRINVIEIDSVPKCDSTNNIKELYEL